MIISVLVALFHLIYHPQCFYIASNALIFMAFPVSGTYQFKTGSYLEK